MSIDAHSFTLVQYMNDSVNFFLVFVVVDGASVVLCWAAAGFFTHLVSNFVNVLFSFLNALVWDWRLLLSELMVNRKANLLRSLQFLFPFPSTIAFVFCLLLRIQFLTLIKCQWGAMSQVLASRPPLWGVWLVKKDFNFSSHPPVCSGGAGLFSLGLVLP